MQFAFEQLVEDAMLEIESLGLSRIIREVVCYCSITMQKTAKLRRNKDVLPARNPW